eukprot:CAMPEP_0179372742 /NCGR_PEP_ID=MMETSP0797-20121207/86452_1 /TAXON_ID=47934 /ORGANISM="Dinophysis acuminata, Strain DAEP01" /LENGTH=107 /DNA_ID=CAMNT_0021088743 /DNA_START=16 /DNA_END=339 /DNA_ORIENTATION=+
MKSVPWLLDDWRAASGVVASREPYCLQEMKNVMSAGAAGGARDDALAARTVLGCILLSDLADVAWTVLIAGIFIPALIRMISTPAPPAGSQRGVAVEKASSSTAKTD